MSQPASILALTHDQLPPGGDAEKLLVVKVELWPGGHEALAREIGRAAVVNIRNLADLSDYIVIGSDDHGHGPMRIVRRHRRDDGFWALLARAFTPGGPGRLPNRWKDAECLIVEKARLRPADPH